MTTTKPRPKTITLGPVTVTQYRWRQIKGDIAWAFGEWEALAGRLNDDRREEYRDAVLRERFRINALIAALEGREVGPIR